VLRALTDRRLSQTAEPEEYVNLLQALLSFEGVEVWDRCLEGLHTGEYEVGCPYCGVNVLLAIGDEDGWCTSGEYILPEAQKTRLRPARVPDLEELPRRLFARATADGQVSVARGVRYLFGWADCPDCGTDFSVAERVSARWIP
jgi:hypothetical protein